jgi:hypothetical protein
MSWAIVLSARSGVAVTLGTMVAIFALSVPGPAFAAPVPPVEPDCLAHPDNPACQPPLPTNPDATGCTVNPYAVGCQSDPFGPAMDPFNPLSPLS